MPSKAANAALLLALSTASLVRAQDFDYSSLDARDLADFDSDLINDLVAREFQGYGGLGNLGALVEGLQKRDLDDYELLFERDAQEAPAAEGGAAPDAAAPAAPDAAAPGAAPSGAPGAAPGGAPLAGPMPGGKPGGGKKHRKHKHKKQ